MQRILKSLPKKLQRYYGDTTLEIEREALKSRKEKNVFKMIQNIVGKAPIGWNQRKLQDYQGLINLKVMKDFYREVKNQKINFTIRSIDSGSLRKLTQVFSEKFAKLDKSFVNKLPEKQFSTVLKIFNLIFFKGI